MKTIQHIKVGNEDYAPTGEELQTILHEFMATGKTLWPMEIFRIEEDDGFMINPGENLENEMEKMFQLEDLVFSALRDPAGATIVTNRRVILHRVSKVHFRSNIKPMAV